VTNSPHVRYYAGSMAKKALVTGGAGFIGSHLVDALAREEVGRDGDRRSLDGLAERTWTSEQILKN
jgi:nucleoside-diphosphate-sugar epimerase